MFGANGSTTDGTARPDSKLYKCHTALTFYRVREAIAPNIVGYYCIIGKTNPTDIHHYLLYIYDSKITLVRKGSDNKNARLIARDSPSPVCSRMKSFGWFKVFVLGDVDTLETL